MLASILIFQTQRCSSRKRSGSGIRRCGCQVEGARGANADEEAKQSVSNAILVIYHLRAASDKSASSKILDTVVAKRTAGQLDQLITGIEQL